MMSGALHDAIAALIQQLGLEAAGQHINATGSPAARQEFKRQRETLLAADLSRGNTPAPVVREKLIAEGMSRRTAYRRIGKARDAQERKVVQAALREVSEACKQAFAEVDKALRAGGPAHYEHPIQQQEQESMKVVDQLLAAHGLRATLSQASTTVTTRVLRIGPAEAKALLAANRDNRVLRPGRVRYYARVMRMGQWKLTHQGIAFCVDGRGLDLQHRLSAVIESGMTVDMMVTEGLSPDAFDAIDQHERRSVSDALRIDRQLTDVARMLILVRGGSFAAHPTILEIGEVAETVGPLHSRLMEVCNSRRATMTSAPVRAAAILLMGTRPEIAEKVALTYRSLALGRSEEWPRVLHAFNRQHMRGDVSTHGYAARVDLMARAMVALDPKRADLSKIQISNDAIDYLRGPTVKLIGEVDGAAPEEA